MFTAHVESRGAGVLPPVTWWYHTPSDVSSNEAMSKICIVPNDSCVHE
jgi:hypothetical protein